MFSDAIARHASSTPDKPAIIMGGSGEAQTYAELEEASNRAANFLRTFGLRSGDRVAFCLENGFEVFHVAWAALRSGLVIVPISSKLTTAEIAYIVRDSEAQLLVTSPLIGAAFDRMPEALPGVPLFTTGTRAEGFATWADAIAASSASPVLSPTIGSEMLYSSGTTGRPKGIEYGGDAGEGGVSTGLLKFYADLGLDESMVYLSPAPLYHSAPFCWSLATVRTGGTVVVMERFDAEQALRLIERYGVTVSQWVPTHFVRMLKLPEDVRQSFDVSSMTLALHAAAPCPVPTKEAMIEWWGPVVFEYFGSSEQSVLTMIDSKEALAHPGSVGRAVTGTLHICDDDGEPLPAGQIGHIYSEGGVDFAYHLDPAKTAASRNRRGWTTVNDLGYLDSDGYLYLTDRKSFMIISGGVNIYPQEIESLLVTHPRIADAAVIGLPDADLGEKVTAIIQPMDVAEASSRFAAELTDWMRQHLSSVKIPKRIEFCDELPRLPTGKVVKHLLKERYA